jgi:hypothetical protein
MTTEETAPEDTVTEDAPSAEDGVFSEDVLEAGAGLGEPVPDEPDPRARTLKLLIGISLLGVLAAGTAAAFAPTLHPALAAAWALLVLGLLAFAGLRLVELRKIAEPSVALFAAGFVHATEEGLEAVAFDRVELAYLTPGKRLILQLEDGRSVELRTPLRNFERLEKAVRAGVPRDRIRRGAPPKPLAAV